MTTDEIVTRLLSECPSLTAAERERAQRPFDKLYIDEASGSGSLRYAGSPTIMVKK